jgi:hypothetical protein
LSFTRTTLGVRSSDNFTPSCRSTICRSTHPAMVSRSMSTRRIGSMAASPPVVMIPTKNAAAMDVATIRRYGVRNAHARQKLFNPLRFFSATFGSKLMRLSPIQLRSSI